MKVQILNRGNKSVFQETRCPDDMLFDVRNHIVNEDGSRLYFVHFPGCGRNGKAPEGYHPTVIWTSPDAQPSNADINPYGYSDFVVKDHIYVEERHCAVITPGTNMQAKSLLSKE